MNSPYPIKIDNFPPLLPKINDPPKKLWVRGRVFWNNMPDLKFLCVVGSRKYSDYGKQVCEKLIEGLSGYHICIVSGLAYGIDSIAHRAAMNAGMKTIAIPGSGLDDNVLYPRQHFTLAQDILNSGGALLSEFDLDFVATPWSFPQRNRIMSGMSHATLIIEAEEKSGTLITAQMAMDYNRDVLVTPGSIFSDGSYGPHLLLRDGATPITSSSDILEALGLKKRGEDLVQTHPQNTRLNFDEIPVNNCSDEEKIILKMISRSISRDELFCNANISVQKLNTILMMLEINGYIKECNNNIIRL